MNAEVIADVQRLLKTLRPDLEAEIDGLDTSASLFKSGLVDSLTFVTLIELVEREYGVRVPPEQMLPGLLGTLRQISSVVSALRGAPGKPSELPRGDGDAIHDGLTRIFSRKYFLERLGADVAYAVRHSVPLSLLLIDIDDFAELVSVHGQPAGDHVLVSLAQRVSGSLRKEDVLARYGGTELAVLCAGIDSKGALAFAERLQRMIESATFELNGVTFDVKVSIGVGTSVPAATPHPTLIELTESALSRARRDGNRVSVGEPWLT